MTVVYARTFLCYPHFVTSGTSSFDITAKDGNKRTGMVQMERMGGYLSAISELLMLTFGPLYCVGGRRKFLRRVLEESEDRSR